MRYVENRQTMNTPKISLCMIVKDEEEMLTRCLASAKDFVDEIVVVDTGSRDRSVEIAEGFGARVRHHPWEDDFSKHRNQSIGYASGDWFMYLDADEEIVESTGRWIRKAVLDQDVDSVTFEFVSLYGGGKKSLHTQQRLFRLDRGIHFKGRIHNRVVGVRSTRLYPVRVLHYGYDLDQERARLKHERRIRILEKEIEEDPVNPIHHHYLAVSHLSAPDYEKAAEQAAHALALIEGSGDEKNFFYAWTHYVSASSLHRLGRLREADEVCRLGLSRFPDDPDLLFASCETAFASKDSSSLLEYATRYLSVHERFAARRERAGQMHWVTYDQSWKIAWFLAVRGLWAGDHNGFQEGSKKALDLAASKGEVYHATARYYIDTGDFEKAKGQLEKAALEGLRTEEIIYSWIELSIRLKDTVQEVGHWGEFLDRFPGKKTMMMEEVERALDQGRLQDGRKLLQALLSRDPANRRVLSLSIRLGLLFLEAGIPAESKDLLQSVHSIHETEPAPCVGLAILHWKAGDLQSCSLMLDQTLNLLGTPMETEIVSIEELGALFALIGERFLFYGPSEAAVLCYRTALELNCSPFSVHHGLAMAYKKGGRYQESLSHLRTGMSMSADTETLLSEMGELYRLLGNSEAAEFCLRKSQRTSSQ
jgi:glycosyltransferase involved in cell wall biosynthesis